MKYTDIPTRVPLPFANAGTKNTIPTASQISITPGAASLNDGFPPLCFTPKAAGGIPPAGADMNGILNLISANTMWQNAGGIHPYNSAFSTAVGGYPKGALVRNSIGDGFWESLIDDNTADPDSDTTGKWFPFGKTSVAVITLSNSNVTLTPAQFAADVVSFVGTLTGNVQVIFPNINGKQWLLINNCTGAFTVTCKTAAGSGTIPNGYGGSRRVISDGTNVLSLGVDVSVPQTAHTIGFTPVSSTTYDKTVSFTAPCNGHILGFSTINVGGNVGDAGLPAPSTNKVIINGTEYQGDQTIHTMLNCGIQSVLRNTACTVTSRFIAGATGSAWPTVSQIITSIFIPNP